MHVNIFLFHTLVWHYFLSLLTLFFNSLFSDKVEEDAAVVDSKILQYCSIDKKEKKSVGEMEQEFLQALQVRTGRDISILACSILIS